jgi:hypothetical protein
MHTPVTRDGSVRNWVSEREIAAVLRGERVTPSDPPAFAYSAVRHAVAALLVKRRIAERLPQKEAARLLDESRRQAAVVEFRDRAARTVIEALHQAGIQALVLKGIYLGHTLYPESFLRAREDTDLLIPVSERSRTLRVLRELGYERQAEQTGDAVLGQIMFDRPHGPGAPLDVHWRLARPHVAAALFDLEAMMARAIPVPRLGDCARGPALPDALALACVHRAAHHPGHDLLLWTYDVHLLVGALSPEQADAFVTMAIERRMAALCGAIIQEAYEAFRHPRAAAFAAQLTKASGAEPSAALATPRPWWTTLPLDLRAVPHWGERVRLLAGHAFPPAAYMRTTFAPSSRAPLPWLYARRIARALRQGKR